MPSLPVASFLMAAVLASPSPQATTLKTIVTVHSSQFCTALEKSVRPALAALIHNDTLIERGRSEFAAAGQRASHGGSDIRPTGAQLQGPPVESPSQADTMIVEGRQRQLAKNLEDNIETIESILTDKKRFAIVTANEEAAKLQTIATELTAIAAKQRTAVNFISGEVEGQDLVALYNRPPSWGGADSTYGVSPLESMKARHGGEGDSIYNVWQAATLTTKPFYDPYLPFTDAIADDQHSIADAEGVATQAIIEAAGGCK